MKQQNADGKGGWKRAAGAGQGYSWDRTGAEGVQGVQVRGTLRGFKGTELMQAPGSGLGEGLIHTRSCPRLP